VGGLILAELLVLELVRAVWTILKILIELALVKQRFRKVYSTEPEMGFLFYFQVLRADYSVFRHALLPFHFLLHTRFSFAKWVAAKFKYMLTKLLLSARKSGLQRRYIVKIKF
jgi:hypothetical protein